MHGSARPEGGLMKKEENEKALLNCRTLNQRVSEDMRFHLQT